MIKKKKILAIIPARGGSKGLPGKNIKNICGKPLIAWTIGQAKASCYIDRTIVSTDDETIAGVAKQYGGDVPFLRPPEFAADDSPTSDAILHVLEQLKRQQESYDYLILLEPTSPLRKPNDIDDAISKLVQISDADSLISVGEVHMEHPMITKRIDDDGFVEPYIPDVIKIHQRQQADNAYFPYGVIYISKVSSFFEQRTFYTKKTIPYFIERWQNYEIDDEFDFMIIDQMIKIKMEMQNG